MRPYRARAEIQPPRLRLRAVQRQRARLRQRRVGLLRNANIRATYGQTEQTHYTVPLGKTCRPKRASINVARSSGALGSAEMRFWVRKAGKSWVVKRNWFFATGEHEKVLTGIVLPARSQMRVDVESVSDTDTNISAEIDFDLVDE